MWKKLGSENVSPNSCILPQSGMSFLLLDIQQVTEQNFKENVENILLRVDSFVKGHRFSYLIILAIQFDDNTQSLLATIQKQFLNTNLICIPVCDAKEGVQAIATIAEATQKNNTDQFVHCQKIPFEGYVVSNAINELNISDQEGQMLLDGLGSLSQISKSSIADICDCSIDSISASKIYEFFNSAILERT